LIHETKHDSLLLTHGTTFRGIYENWWHHGIFKTSPFNILEEEFLISGLFIYEGWNFNSGNYIFTTDTK